MQTSNQPAKVSVPFASSGNKQPIPVASQVGTEDGRASFTDGFPPLTRTPLAAGGKPPFGTDMNGILYAITQIQQWQSAGGSFAYDADFATAVGGYPKGAKVDSADRLSTWVNTVDGNTTNPDAGGAGWVALSSAGVVGQSRNVAMSVPTASASATVTADQIIVQTAGGLSYRILGFGGGINLATTGVGGMNSGVAPASGYVSIYAIYNPTTRTSALLAFDTTTLLAPETAPSLPSGYTASALLIIVQTTASRLIYACAVIGRKVYFAFQAAVSSTTAVPALTAVNLTPIVPKNAKYVSGEVSIGTTAATSASVTLAANIQGIARRSVAGSSAAGASTAGSPFSDLPLVTPQQMFWQANIIAGTFNSAQVNISGFEF